MNMQMVAGSAAKLVVLATLLLLGACDDPFGPLEWDATPDTATIWSASRAELVGQPSGFDFALSVVPVHIETAGGTDAWDVVLIDAGGRLALAPASYFTGQGKRSAIAPRAGATLAEVRRAPSDTTDYLRTPVPLESGTVYVVRTRVAICEGGYSTGTRYAKIRPLTIDEQAGSFTFELVRNPYCSNRNFVPPNSDN
jgi:hypothetical protein